MDSSAEENAEEIKMFDLSPLLIGNEMITKLCLVEI